MTSSRGSAQSRDQTCISYVSCIGRWALAGVGTWSGRAAAIREGGGQAPAGPAGESQPELAGELCGGGSQCRGPRRACAPGSHITNWA